MDSTDPTAIIILSEIVVIETIIIIVFAISFFLKKKKSITQLKEIIRDHEKNTQNRKSELKSTYSTILKLQNSNPEKVIDDLIEHETKFFQNVIKTINTNNISSIRLIDEKIHDLVSPYVQLIPTDTSESTSSEKEESPVPDIDSAIDDLLSDEADDAEGDPALDLSEELESEDKIEEMPEELLVDTNTSIPSSEDDPSPPKNIDETTN